MKKTIRILPLLFCLTIIPIGNQEYEATSLKEWTTDDTSELDFMLKSNPDGLKVETNNLFFGKHTVRNDVFSVYSEDDNMISVKEFSGNRPGWTLKVQLDKFVDTYNSKNIAEGAQLFYPKVIPTPKTTEGKSKDNPPEVYGDSPSFMDPQNPNLKGLVVSDTNAPVVIARAQDGKGYGQWDFDYKNINRIQLKVPEKQGVGSYQAVLTYTIEDGPRP